jgi:hypothetical protein
MSITINYSAGTMATNGLLKQYILYSVVLKDYDSPVLSGFILIGLIQIT